MPAGVRVGAGPTMRDVAREAGVSKALVSIVFRGAPGASEESRRRVFEAAGRIGYRTNRTASLLALSRSRQLGVVVDLHNGFHAEVIDGVLTAADHAGYRVVPSPRPSTHSEERAISTAMEFRCEALLLVGSDLDRDVLAALTAGTPVISVGRPFDLDNVDVVRCSEEAGMDLLVEHVARLGHTRIAHIDGGTGGIAAARRAGFEEGARRHRLVDGLIVMPGGRTEQEGARAARELLRRVERPTAVVAFNDHCALGVIATLTRAGVRVPEDISVTGYDDSPLAQLSAISLTSVRQEAAELARWAVAAAVERLDDGRVRPRESILIPRLVVRGTTAPPPVETIARK